MSWAERRDAAQMRAAAGLPKQDSRWLVIGAPFLFVVGLPALFWGWFVMSPADTSATAIHAAKVADAEARHAVDLREEIRKCSVGLDEARCKEAIYCADDPVACAYIMQGETVDERQP